MPQGPKWSLRIDADGDNLLSLSGYELAGISKDDPQWPVVETAARHLVALLGWDVVEPKISGEDFP